jgi:hypothetical protein
MTKGWESAFMAKKFCGLIVIIISVFIGNTVYAKTDILLLRSWTGTYEYGDTIGETQGSMPIIVDITLTLKSNGYCETAVEGYMHDEHILCQATPQDSAVKIAFIGYSEDQQTRPVGSYSRGDLLFVLVKKDGVLLTKWEKLKPFPSVKKIGKYFQ